MSDMSKEALEYQAVNATRMLSKDMIGSASSVIVVPNGARTVSAEDFQAQPNAIAAHVKLHTAASFVAYVNRFKGQETSVYLNVRDKEPGFAAVLDHHGLAAPAWRRHTAQFVPQLSLEWKAWKELAAEKWFDQEVLIRHIEDHYVEIEKPDSSVVLAAVSDFEHTEKHVYESARNLNNGMSEFKFLKGSASATVKFPHELGLWLSIFEGEGPVSVEGRLRYMARDGELLFSWQFKQDPQRLERDAARAIAEQVKYGIEGVSVYEGSPPTKSNQNWGVLAP